MTRKHRNHANLKFSLALKIRYLSSQSLLIVWTSFILYFCFFSYQTDAYSADQPDENKLAALKLMIEKIQAELIADNKEKDQAVYLLQLAEKEVAKASNKLYQTENKLRLSQQKLESLQEEEKQLHQQLITNRLYLQNQIRAAYSIGKQEYVKLLLNQEDPASVARMVVYYQYFNQSRAHKLEQIDSRLLRLKTISQDIEAQTSKFKSLQQTAFDEKETLKNRRNQRSSVVASLSASLKKKNALLNSMLRDEQHLKKLLKEIETQLTDVQTDLTPPKAFGELKGQLQWPAIGQIAARFDSARNGAGNLKWKGVLIETQPGNTVNAVAYGRVVFADWLRGFGMLIIIDHGDSYMSLYGHNEQLHKKLGDWVQAGETIATSGHSGGQLATSLYFEIRHKGKPQDPVKWCKSLPGRS